MGSKEGRRTTIESILLVWSKVIRRIVPIWIAAGLLLFLLAGCGNSAGNHSSEPSPSVTAQTEESATPTAAQEETEQPAMLEFKRLANVFGFADETGERLITIPDESGAIEMESPEQFTEAIGDNGKRIELEFVRLQQANDQDTNRQSMYNFNNMAGYVYKATNGKLVPNKSYLLVKNGVIGAGALVELKSALDDQSESGEYKPAEAAVIERIEAAKSRKVAVSRLLAEAEEGQIVLVVFERQADDMLASLVYIDGEQIVFKDYPAEYNESGTWRVDSGDDPGLFEAMFLAGSDEGLLLGISWGAPEGENLYVLKETDGILQETELRSGRYWAP